MFFVLVYGKDMFDVHYNESDSVLDSQDTITEDLLKKRHLTTIFNTFVFLQWFNFLNCRVVGPREFNIFKGFGSSSSNFVLLAILIVIFGVQYLTCRYGVAYPFDTVKLSTSLFW